MKVMHWDTFVFLPGECYMILFISRYKYIYLWHDTCFFFTYILAIAACAMCFRGKISLFHASAVT